MATFDNAAKRAQFMIDRHRTETGLEGDAETILLHILGDALEWCDAQSPRIDFDATLASAREMLRDCDG